MRRRWSGFRKLMPYGLVLLSFGCADPMAPTEANFSRAIIEKSQEDFLCLSNGGQPLFQGKAAPFSAPFVDTAASHWPVWDELVKAGMFTKEEVREPHTYTPSFDKKVPLPLYSVRYALSENFKKFLVTQKSPFFGSQTKLCVAPMKFEKIVAIDGPHVAFGGPTVANVKYQLRAEQLPTEITSHQEIFEKYFPEILKERQSITKEITFFLTKGGWKTKDSIKDPAEVIMQEGKGEK